MNSRARRYARYTCTGVSSCLPSRFRLRKKVQTQTIEGHFRRAALNFRARAAPGETVGSHAASGGNANKDGADRCVAAVAIRPGQARGADGEIGAKALTAARC